MFEGVTLDTSLRDALTYMAESLRKQGADPKFAEVTEAKRRMIFDRGAALLYGLINFIPIAKEVKTAVDLAQTLVGDKVDASPGATDTMQRLVENLEEWIAAFDEFAQLYAESTRTLDEIDGLSPPPS